MPGTRHLDPVVAMVTPEAPAHRLSPLVWRTHAPECSHGCGVAANVHRHHRDAEHQLRRPCGEQECDGAAVAVADQVNRLDTSPGEHRLEVGDVLVEHRGGETA